MKRLDEHTDVYLYKEQLEDHHSRLDLITKQPQEDVYSLSQLPHFEREYQYTRSDGESNVVT